MTAQSNRVTVLRSLTRKKGENYEKLVFGAEVNLPSGMTLEQAFEDLNQTVTMALQKATEERERGIEPTQPVSVAALKPPAPKIETIEIKSKSGTLLGIAEATADSFIVEPCVEVKADLRSFQGFLIPRILAPIREKHGGQYRVDADNRGFLTQISLREMKLDEARIKELVKAVAWTLEHALEKTEGPKP